MLAIGFFAVAQAALPPAAAQSGSVSMSALGLMTPCGDRICPPLSDPLTRDGFVLRLLALERMPDASGMPGALGGQAKPGEWAEWQARQRERAEKTPGAWVSRGSGEAHAGRYAAAQPLLQKALELSLAEGDLQGEATSLSNLGVVAAMLGRYDEARLRMEAALAVFTRLAREPQLPPGLAIPPLPPTIMGRPIPPATAKEFATKYRQGLLEREARAGRHGAFVVELNLGSVAASLAQYGEAIARFGQALALGRADTAEDNGGERAALGELALLYRKSGDTKEAARYRREALAKPPEDDERRLTLFMSEVALGGTTLTARAPEPEPQAPSAPALSPAVQQLKQRLEGMMSSAAQAQMAQMSPLFAACDKGQCSSPGDPAQRTGYGMRLAGAMRIPVGAAWNDGKATGAASPLFVNAAGVKLASQGRLDAARAQWMKALEGSAGGRDPLAEAVALANLGAADAMQGRHDEARSRLKAALAAYDKSVAAGRGARLRAPPSGPAEMAAAMQALPALMDGENADDGMVLVALNLANLEAHLARYAEADAWFQQALQSAQRGHHGSMLVLSEMAVMERLRGRGDAAADLMHRSRAGTENSETWNQVEVGFLALGGAPAAVTTQRPPVPPPVRNDTTLAMEEAKKGVASESVHARLAAEGAERERAGDIAAAIAAFDRAALLAASAANVERERAALASLQRLHARRGDAEATIFYGKRSVNAIQRLRQSLTQLDRAARQSFLAEKKQTYVLLAQTLLDCHRLPEAEQVLRLLKEDEGQQVQEAARTRGTVPYTTQEAAALQVFDRLAERLRPIETRRAGLVGGLNVDGAVDSRAAIERARLLNLNRADQTLSMLEAAGGTIDEAASRCPRLAGKPPSARSAAEADQLAECLFTLRTAATVARSGAESVRALKADGAGFLASPSKVEQRQIDAVLARFVALQARLAQALAPVRELAAASGAPSGRPAPGLADMLVDTGRLHDLWSTQIEIDGLMAQAGQAASHLVATSAPRGEPDFTPDARAALEAGRRLMNALPAGTAAIYYLGGEQRLDILLVTAEGWTQARTDVSRAALVQRIEAFRRVLKEPGADPVPPARDLYGLLVAPVDGALKAARATTLMIALEGPLRYVPFSALHDGEGWLAERYATSLYTTAAPTALTAEPARSWQAAAFGSTAVGTGLPLLPAVRQELQAIVRDPAQGTKGVMPGVIRLDRDFTAQALRDALRKRPNVVHLASHFAYEKEDAGASFLLLGDGGHLTLNQLGGADFRFDQVDLVTLSACETALVAGNSFGQEVEALGTLLQAQGASAVLSTLWSIADASTAQFMRRMYEVRESGVDGRPRVSRAQALRAAQLSFIRPQANGAPVVAPQVAAPAASAGQRGGARVGDASDPPDPGRPYAHPYFWAPFVLMGNWL